MKQPWHGNNKNYREQIDDMVLHFINGFMIMDERTAVSSPVLFYKATIYSDEHIGEITDSDIMIGYNENQQVWVTVRNSDGSSFEWDNRERDRKVTVLFYVLLYTCYIAAILISSVISRFRKKIHGKIIQGEFRTCIWILLIRYWMNCL